MHVYGYTLTYQHIDILKSLFQQYFALHQQAIPKHIHQVWIGPNKPPWVWLNSFRQQFMAQHPDWQYTLWREEDIAGLTLINRQQYQQESGLAGKVDILRYELLYQFGGVYIDADMQWLNDKSLDHLLEDVGTSGIFVGRENHMMLANSVIGAAAANPILALVMKVLQQSYQTTRQVMALDPWQSTGPWLFSQVSLPFDITIYPQHYFYPVHWLQSRIGIDTTAFPDSYMIQYGYTTNGLAEVFNNL